MSTTEVRNPLFARVYPPLARMMEREVARHRDALLADLSGHVVELGEFAAERSERAARATESVCRALLRRGAHTHWTTAPGTVPGTLGHGQT